MMSYMVEQVTTLSKQELMPLKTELFTKTSLKVAQEMTNFTQVVARIHSTLAKIVVMTSFILQLAKMC